ncbi:MAG TPA: hypothetical protein VH083_12920, partial [Myxococcales bacterium]|nr:hypothetical protein [Myxococcales bacterium]
MKERLLQRHLRHALEEQPAAVQNSHAGHQPIELGQQMAGDDDGRALLAIQLEQQLANLGDAVRVQAVGGLVQDEQPGLVEDGLSIDEPIRRKTSRLSCAPKMRMLPCCKRSNPKMSRSAVVLPAPVGPRNVDAAFRHGEAHFPQHRRLELVTQSIGFEGEHGFVNTNQSSLLKLIFGEPAHFFGGCRHFRDGLQVFEWDATDVVPTLIASESVAPSEVSSSRGKAPANPRARARSPRFDQAELHFAAAELLEHV